ncbi:MAG: hypothetical protein GX489_10285 [Firmicutes bacterium]|jgi:D-alanine-D-alanine ligase|nr:hypothetical protein [Bacillota bacterium]
MPGRILFMYNAVAEAQRHGYFTECMTFTQIDIMGEALGQTGHEVVHLNLQSPEQLKQVVRMDGPFTIAFCIAEGFLDLPISLVDGSGAAWVRHVLEDLNVAATHSDAATLDICRHKDRTYKALNRFGLAVPPHVVIRPGADSLEKQLHTIERKLSFPLFVKPAGGGNSVGISERSVVRNFAELTSQVDALLGEFGDFPLLVETYLPGREYTVGIMGNRDKLVLPIIAFPFEQKIRTLAAKRAADGDRPGQEIITIGDPLYHKLSKLTAAAFDAVSARDVLRIDIREDSEGNPIIIDVNAIPTMTPSASLPQMAAWAGFSYDCFIELFLNIALERVYGQTDVINVYREERGINTLINLEKLPLAEFRADDKDR